jgi:predicted transcriptional regulator
MVNIHILNNMKAITINVSESIYRAFQDLAKSKGRSTAELIREAMELYWNQRGQPRTSLQDWRPVSAGKVLRPLFEGDDLLEEMLNHD